MLEKDKKLTHMDLGVPCSFSVAKTKKFSIAGNRKFATFPSSVYLSELIAQNRGYTNALVHPLVIMQQVFNICKSCFIDGIVTTAHSIDYNKNLIVGLKYTIQIRLALVFGRHTKVFCFKILHGQQVWATGKLTLFFP